MNQYEISLCDYENIAEVQSFINTYWKAGHILATNRTVVDWQYYDKQNLKYNFLTATNPDNKQLVGILGFISTYLFDQNLEHSVDIWGSVWKVIPSTSKISFDENGIIKMGLGTDLLNNLIAIKNVRSYGAIGINKKVAQLYRFLGFSVGALNHYYIVNQKKTSFNILNNFDGVFSLTQFGKGEHDISFIESTGDDFEINFSDVILPTKSKVYFVNRYLKHPFYKYTLLRITNNESERCILVYRIVEANDTKALRIVDFLGSPIALLGAKNVFQNILEKYDAEYLDFYNYGIPEEILREAGFLLRSSKNPVVIPNYFEPFERRNVDIMFAYKVFREGAYKYSACKGDADQDRPNYL